MFFDHQVSEINESESEAPDLKKQEQLTEDIEMEEQDTILNAHINKLIGSSRQPQSH